MSPLADVDLHKRFVRDLHLLYQLLAQQMSLKMLKADLLHIWSAHARDNSYGSHQASCDQKLLHDVDALCIVPPRLDLWLSILACNSQ